MTTENKDVLEEVRKAYRLLFDFQDRILNLIDFIGNSYGMTYTGGYPKFSDPAPRNRGGKLDKWAWDWLNMYYYIFLFAEDPESHAGITLGVFLIADDGYFRALKNGKEANRTSLKSFEDVGDSDTKLIFVVGKDYWKTEGIFGENWAKPEFTMAESEVQNEEGGNGKMVLKSFNLADFFDQQSAKDKLKDFSAFCRDHEIEFNVDERDV